MADDAAEHRGGCLCGAVRFTLRGELPDPNACHCGQCRKSSGHYWASADVPQDALEIEEDGALRWYCSSQKVRRGFCGTCGASLFWDPLVNDMIAVAMGAFDGPTGARLAMHIFTADKGDYYEIADGLPQNPQ